MAKSKKSIYEKEMLEGIRTGNYNLSINAGKKLYNYLSKSEKEHVKQFAQAGKIKEAYATSLTDSLMSKANKQKINQRDVRNMTTNMDIVKDRQVRAAELSMKSFRNSSSGAYYDFVKKSGLYKETRKTSEISAKMQYKGGSRKEGYIFHRKIGNKIWEIQTPGYDEDKGALHGYRYRELGSNAWIGG